MAAKRRIFAFALALVILLAVTSSLFIIIHEADHDCCGEDCPVCALIEACADTVKNVSVFIAVLVFASSALILLISGVNLLEFFGRKHTPVTLKIKLLN